MEILERYFSLEGQVALVTGASGGIGTALSKGLAAAGAKVALHGRDQGKLDALKEDIAAQGHEAETFAADLDDQATAKALIARVNEHFGRLDILVNNAGMNRRKPVKDVSNDDYESIMNVNLRSVFFLCQAAAETMGQSGGGKIIQIASLTSSMGLGTNAVYGMSKAAVAQMTQTLAVEWAKDNIQVNALAPGFIMTPLTQKALWGDDKKVAWLRGRIPCKRPGMPDEMVATALLMAGPGSSYLTGQLITVDGGVLAGGSWEA